MCDRLMIVALAVFLAGCTRGPQEDLRPFVAAAGYYALMESQATPTPAPPAPKPGPRTCENCNGLGYLTDGTVRTVCPVCRGNKVTSGAAQCQSGTCRSVLTGR